MPLPQASQKQYDDIVQGGVRLGIDSILREIQLIPLKLDVLKRIWAEGPPTFSSLIHHHSSHRRGPTRGSWNRETSEATHVRFDTASTETLANVFVLRELALLSETLVYRRNWQAHIGRQIPFRCGIGFPLKQHSSSFLSPPCAGPCTLCHNQTPPGKPQAGSRVCCHFWVRSYHFR
ncbi:hypothetical protein VTI74DRAFT_7008 [Chaetomium olivicolor]